MHVQPYLFFDGRCEEALEFYRNTLGAEITALMHFKDNPDFKDGSAPTEGCMGPQYSDDKVMHASFHLGDTTVMVADGQCRGQPNFQGFSLAITVSEKDEAERLFTALGEGGQVQMPLAETFFSPRFGMVADKFGVSWMIVVEMMKA
ncbi:VOC family protein [Halomonas sp. M20]|uniref:VOC family protein n=1 Tax=Halomonas sp. M20 TaxID=2763264 RepID=UPI001D0A5C32|nr:VOC family protein [Halomonas sp. M20]